MRLIHEYNVDDNLTNTVAAHPWRSDAAVVATATWVQLSITSRHTKPAPAFICSVHTPTSIIQLVSTHADRQGVDISFTVCLFVCTVTDFSGQDKASGVKFCTVVQGRPGQGISHFGQLYSPRSPKWDESVIHQEVKFRVEMATLIVSVGNAYDRHVWITSVPDKRTYMFILHKYSFNCLDRMNWNKYSYFDYLFY